MKKAYQPGNLLLPTEPHLCPNLMKTTAFVSASRVRCNIPREIAFEVPTKFVRILFMDDTGIQSNIICIFKTDFQSYTSYPEAVSPRPCTAWVYQPQGPRGRCGQGIAEHRSSRLTTSYPKLCFIRSGVAHL